MANVVDEEHDCLDSIVNNGLGMLVCGECGEVIDRADATCTLCGHYPCSCDDQYEAFRDRELDL